MPPMNRRRSRPDVYKFVAEVHCTLKCDWLVTPRLRLATRPHCPARSDRVRQPVNAIARADYALFTAPERISHTFNKKETGTTCRHTRRCGSDTQPQFVAAVLLPYASNPASYCGASGQNCKGAFPPRPAKVLMRMNEYTLRRRRQYP